jgi:pyruvate ferredoxin oxidoreductase beta subunit
MKVKKATDKKNQPAFIHCITPCPTNWKNQPSMSVEVARRAVKCGIWPLWEYEQGSFRRMHEPKEFAPVEEYLEIQGRFKHVSEEDIEDMRAYIKDLNYKIDRFVFAYTQNREASAAGG